MMGTALIFVFLLFFPQVCAAAQGAAQTLPACRLEVTFDLGESKVAGEATLQVSRERELRILGGEFQFLEAAIDRRRIQIPPRQAFFTLRLKPGEKARIRYAGVFKPPPPAGGSMGGDRPEVPPRVIGEEGIFLTGAWYPRVEGFCRYELAVNLPPGYQAVSEAEEAQVEEREGRRVFSFSFPHPLDSLTLVASSRYRVFRDSFEGTEILAYFFPEDEPLASPYIEAAKKYLALYGKLLGKFPYRRFAIVENFLPTGYSMPTYTLLGQGVVRLPFILETSLGHEILHQWFGNLVYVDEEKGNWAEGLTSYLADHWYEERKGKGFAYRKGALADYRSYVNPGNEIPLTDFRGRTGRPSQAIGYGKALMVFHMLRNLVGEGAFFEALRALVEEKRFRQASWQDFQRAFEKSSGRDLGWFFRQWVAEKGLLEFHLGEAGVRALGGRFEVDFEVNQRGGVYAFDLPVAFDSPAGRVKSLLRVDQEKSRLKVLLDHSPTRMALDEDYDLARVLTGGEFPPVIARLLGQDRPLLVLPPSGEETYARVIEHFKEKGSKVEKPGGVKPEDFKGAAAVILGKENPWAERLYGRVESEGGFSLTVKANPWDPKGVVAVLHGESREEVEAAFPKIVHYGKFSGVSFRLGKNLAKTAGEADRGIVRELSRETAGIEVPALKSLSEVIRQVSDRKIIYLGESHDRYAHHLVQLEVIQALHRQGRKVAVGLEMFQRPFQKALDRYVRGETGEREFLKESQYFKRWRFDYRLYRPILQFARAEKIPLVALNTPQEIIEKVGRGGLESLSAEERESIPAQMDFSDRAYRERLERVYREHPTGEGKTFDFFHQAQVLWDETMAESIDRFLSKNPDFQMVVLAGSGHLAHGSGISRRAARRNGLSYAVILNDAEVEKGAADFILFPQAVPLEGSPRLMVHLTEEKGRPIIQAFSHGSVSQKAGLREGDALLSLGGAPVGSIEDVRIDLLFRYKGETVKVKVLRKDPSGGEREADFEVTLH